MLQRNEIPWVKKKFELARQWESCFLLEIGKIERMHCMAYSSVHTIYFQRTVCGVEKQIKLPTVAVFKEATTFHNYTSIFNLDVSIIFLQLRLINGCVRASHLVQARVKGINNQTVINRPKKFNKF